MEMSKSLVKILWDGPHWAVRGGAGFGDGTLWTDLDYWSSEGERFSIIDRSRYILKSDSSALVTFLQRQRNARLLIITDDIWGSGRGPIHWVLPVIFQRGNFVRVDT